MPLPETSKCCNASFHVEGGDEGTNHYECDACGKPTDPRVHEEKENHQKFLEQELWIELNRLYNKNDPRTQEAWDMHVEPLLAEQQRRERLRILTIIKDKLTFDDKDAKFQFISELIDESL